MRMAKRLPNILLPILLAGIMYSCSSKKDDADSDIRPRATVEVAQAAIGNIDETVNTTGTFEVLRDEKVKSTIAGKVQRVFVLEGDAVRKGQVLVTVLSQESNAAITGAARLVSRAGTETEKKQAESALRLAEQTAAVAEITAPFSGVVIRRFVTEGELVGQGADLVEMTDPKTEYFIANVPVSYIGSIKNGQRAVVTIPGSDLKPITGTVQAINPATDPNSQSVQVRVGFEAVPDAVPVGTFGNIVIKTGEKDRVILVPRQAVYHDDELDQYFVWRIQGDSLALLTRVQVGLSDSSRTQITSGIKSGDIVATAGGYGLPDSTDVTVASH
jgi:membrane fusion protein (multidrug efflux system)